MSPKRSPTRRVRSPATFDISFIVPHRPEESIEACVAAVRRALPKGVRAELIAVTGNCPSRQRNMAVAKARGRILHFLDNDSVLTPKAVAAGLRLMRANPKIAVVGGPSLTPDSDSFPQRLFGAVLSSVFAVGPAVRSRYAAVGPRRRVGEYELILCNMMIRAEAFRKAGGFDESMYPNEENILVNRILRLGYEAWYEPSMAVYRSQRRTLREFVGQLLTYGRGRADQLFRDPASFRVFHLLPPTFCLYALLVPFAAGRWPTALLAGAAYLALDLFFSTYLVLYHWWWQALPWLPFLFFCVHFFYGAGMLYGTVKNLLGLLGLRRPPPPARCEIDHVLRF